MQIEWLMKNWFSLLVASLLFVFAIGKYHSGMIRTDGTDLGMPYLGARAWLEGSNPYDGDNLRRIQHAADAESFKFNLEYLPPVYPPATFVLLTPLALLNWPAAMHVWEISAVVMLVLAISAMLNLVGVSWRDPRAWLLVLFCIVFAPLRNAFAMGQNALPAVCLAALSASALRRNRDVLAGLLLAAAICLKPHDVFLFLIYFAMIGRWRAVAWAIAGVTFVAMIAILRPGLSQLGWIPDWLRWVNHAAAPGGINDPSAKGPARFQLLHFPVVLFTILQNRWLVAVLNLLICGSLGAWTAIIIFRRRLWRRADSFEFLAMSAVAVFTLVPTFHRFPDAVLLLFPMAWGMSKLGTPSESVGRITVLLLLPFLIQPYDLIPQLYAHGIVPRTLATVWWWRCFARGSLVWVTLLLSCWMTFALSRDAKHLQRVKQ
jgi:Glycosyltransferase family 87